MEGWRPAEPIPASAAAAGRTEQCPVCLKWMAPQRNGFVRAHKRPVFVPGGTRPFDTERCPGAGTEDRRQRLVRARRRGWVRAMEGRPIGRRAAELFATEWRRDAKMSDIEILERDS